MTSGVAAEKEAQQALVAGQETDVERAEEPEVKSEGAQMTQSGCFSEVPIKPPFLIGITTVAAALLHYLAFPLEIFPEKHVPLLHLWYARVPVGALVAAWLWYLKTQASQALQEAGSGMRFTVVKGIAQNGPFAYTRNPMYLHFLAGWIPMFAFVLNTWWEIAICWVVMALYLRFKIIPAEEKFMERNFEGEWDKYKQDVPRWVKMGPIKV